MNKEELQYILNAIDTYVRANGLSVAAQGALIAKKVQDKAKQWIEEIPEDLND